MIGQPENNRSLQTRLGLESGKAASRISSPRSGELISPDLRRT